MRPGRTQSVHHDSNVLAFALVTAAEAEGFEPPVGCPTLAFKVCERPFGTVRPRRDQHERLRLDSPGRRWTHVNETKNETNGMRGPT